MINEKKKLSNFSRLIDLKKITNNKPKKEINIIKTLNKSIHTYMKILREKIVKKYNCTKEKYNLKILKKLLYNYNCHIVSVFKDHMIYGYIDEYLRRYYKKIEVQMRMPKIYNFYNNYLQFFCKPFIHDFKLNKILQNYYETKAEFFYKDHYNEKENKKKENEKIIETIFSNSIKNNIESITNNNSFNLSIIDNDSYYNKLDSNNSTYREIIDGFYKKIKPKEKKDCLEKMYKKNFKFKKPYYQKKINKEKIINNVKKGIISISIINNNNIKKKEHSPSINIYQYKKKEKSNSKSESKSNIFNNKSISQSKNKLPIGNKIILKKSRNISSFNTLTKDTNTTTNLQNINYSIIKPKKEIKLTKTQNIEKILKNFSTLQNEHYSKKILETEGRNLRYSYNNKLNKTNKSITKIQKKNLRNNPFLYSRNSISKNYIKNNCSMTHNLLNLIFDNSNNNLKRKYHQHCQTNINIDINKKSNSRNKIINKDYLNKKIKHNENVSLNIKNNLINLSRNRNKNNNNSINQKIEKSSFHSKCFTGINLNINLGKRTLSKGNKNKTKNKSNHK